MCESIQRAIAQRTEYIKLLNQWGFENEALTLTYIRVALDSLDRPKYLETVGVTSPGRMSPDEWKHVRETFPDFYTEWQKGRASKREWAGGDVIMQEVFQLCPTHAHSVLNNMAFDPTRSCYRLIE